MNARFLCDENIEAATVGELADRGIEAVHVNECPGRGSSDKTIAATALELDVVLITNDEDFLDPTTYPRLQVFFVPENDLPAHRLARRIDAVIELAPSVSALPDEFFLTEEYEDT